MRKWILFITITAVVTFPAISPAEEKGEEPPEAVPFYDRELSFRGRLFHFTLSRERALETRVEVLDFYLRTGCRLYLDVGQVRQDKNSFDSIGVGLRTFMIEADGTYGRAWSFRLSVGGLTQGGRFDGSQVFIDEGYVAYAADRFRWTAGQQTEPFSLENDMSGLATTFMERALPTALTPGNTVGLSLSTTRGPWFLDTGIFSKDLAGSRDVSNQGLGWSGRVAFIPRADDEKIMHLGASFSWRGLFDLIEDNNTFIRSRPEVGLTDVRFVDTGDLPGINHISRFGLEAAFQAGPVSLQAEYIRTFLSRENAYGDAALDGWYAYASWFPFGGSRKYNAGKALFVYPDVRSAWGEWEVAVRYSMLNLNDGSVRGGKEQNVTFGLNWYLTPKLRIMANYVLIFNDEDADGNGALIGNDNPQVFQMRLQWKF
jgi:phosphate-selective porin OprO/OprP